MISPGVFRLILAMLVVIHHSFPLRLGGWAVGMFFVLSGYWIARMWNEKYSLLPNAYRTFVMSRWWRLAPLFVTTQILATAYSALTLPGSVDLKGLSIGWWVTQPFIIGSTQFGRLLPPSWSLDIEMQFYLLSPILVGGLVSIHSRLPFARAGNGKSVGREIQRNGCDLRFVSNASLLVLFFLVTWSFVLIASGVGAETARWDLYGWLFVSGILAYLNKWVPERAFQWYSLISMIGLVGFVIALPTTRELIWRAGTSANSYSPLSHHLFMMLLGIVGIPLAISTVGRDSRSLDRWLGDLSYPLYLVHWIPRQWYYTQVDWGASLSEKATLLLTNFMIAIVCAFALLLFVDRPIQHLRTKFLRRNKFSHI